ncbi:MAG: glycosyltransferase family 2 protein [Bacteroidetes bacterium]|nr:glycosyltransferase family 2 protein [Bacteroidota bacterium]
MPGLSAVVITFNEEKNISRCIDSLSTIADEIIVVDSFSQDATKKICLDKNVKFIENAFIGYVQQKNFALAQTQFDYVISLDADEYLSTELTESIQQIKNSWKCEAYEMSRLSSYGGRWINHGNWYPDRKIRLWNKSFGSWGGGNPHDRVILKKGTKVSRLRGNILHEAYNDSYETLRKIQSYSDIYARENAHQKSSSVLKIIFRASFTFFKSYIIKRGFLDGFEGLMVAMAESNHTFYKYAKLYEANKQSKNKRRSY